jgi:mRNA-degrading endonuclease RelE of RelBE toxin-antitoxin system
MSGQLQIELTATAEAAYSRFSDEAEACLSKGDECNPKVKFFHILNEALTKIIPADPFNRNMALSGSLSNIFRFSQENLRICYLGHGEQRRVVVLYICQSTAKESDSYATFAYMVMSGKFDGAFASLGLKPPNREGFFPSPSIN